MYLPSFPVQGVRPGFTFPLSTVGRLGHITSPPTRPQFPHHVHRYYVPLRPPLPISGRFAFAPFPIPCCFPSFVSCRFRQLIGEQVRLLRRLGLLFRRYSLSSGCSLKEAGGSPKFVSCPSTRMPRSKIPVVSQALAFFAPGTAAFHHVDACRLSLPLSSLSLRTTMLHVSGFNVAACALASPLLRTPHLWDRTSVPLLACWLDFGLAGFSPAGQLQQISAPIGTSQCFTFHLARPRFCSAVSVFSVSGILELPPRQHVLRLTPVMATTLPSVGLGCF